MKNFLHGLVALTLTATACAAPLEETASDEHPLESAVLTVVPAAGAQGGPRATLRLEPLDAEFANTYSASSGTIQAAPGQVIDIDNRGAAHVFGVYTLSGEKIGGVALPGRQVVSVRLDRPGDYMFTCEDCLGFTPAALAAEDWMAFITLFNEGKALQADRFSTPIQVSGR